MEEFENLLFAPLGVIALLIPVILVVLLPILFFFEGSFASEGVGHILTFTEEKKIELLEKKEKFDKENEEEVLKIEGLSKEISSLNLLIIIKTLEIERLEEEVKRLSSQIASLQRSKPPKTELINKLIR